MSTPPIFIAPQPDHNEMCKHIGEHLKIYWTAPEKLAVPSLGIIAEHLQTCRLCRAKMDRIVTACLPPWEE